MSVRRIGDITGAEVATFGGKAASLGELVDLGMPVPGGFVVTTDAFEEALVASGVESEIEAAVDVDPEDQAAVREAAHRAQSLVRTAAVPDAVRADIYDAYDQIGDGEASVAVRSSATAEDLPDASFAGQQETFLNVDREALLDRVKACWASLFTERAIYYRNEQGYSHRDAAIAVVVQEMVDAEKSGIMFTAPPSKPGDTMLIEAVWGLGEAAVSGTVTPDNYTVDRERKALVEASITEQEKMLTRDPDTGDTVERDVPEARRTGQVLTDDEIEALATLGLEIHDAYGTAQDIEWAIADGEVYLLQSRPITTRGGEEDDDVLTTGLSASPGRSSGPASHVGETDFDRVDPGDVIVTTMTTPDMMPAIRQAAALVTDEGGETCHAAIVSRELGVPAVVGTGDATSVLGEDQTVTVDGDTGSVRSGDHTTAGDQERSGGAEPTGAPAETARPVTGTPVMVNVAIPESADRAAATGADGVGLLRLEHLVLSLGKTPARYVADHGADAYVEELADGIRQVVDAFYPRPVRIRTLDAPTDEFRELEGGEDEPEEANPMLGYRGTRRSLDGTDAFTQQLQALAALHDEGYDNLELMFPLITDGRDVRRIRDTMREAGLDPERTTWGTMIETPASAICIEDIVAEGVDFVSFGTNDLTQYTLAVDRNNERIADRYDATHPAILSLITQVVETCREHGVKTSICGEAGSDPAMIEHLVTAGVDSISVNVDAVGTARKRVAQVERQRLLNLSRTE